MNKLYKRCKKCKNMKHLSKFEDLDVLHCLTCAKKLLRPKNVEPDLEVKSEIALDTRLRRTYKITFSDYERMFNNQKGVCSICQKPPGLKLLSVDHCHKTGKVRGLLCTNCNSALGFLGDSPMNAIRAAKYLKKLI